MRSASSAGRWSVLPRRGTAQSQTERAEAWAKVALLLGITNGMARLTEERIAGALAGVDGQVQISPAMAALTGTPTTAEVAHHALE